jgi:hypothetical protein
MVWWKGTGDGSCLGRLEVLLCSSCSSSWGRGRFVVSVLVRLGCRVELSSVGLVLFLVGGRGFGM